MEIAINQKKNWKYLKSIDKAQHGIVNVDSTIINNSKDKAEALNCQFQSVYSWRSHPSAKL